MSYSMSDRMAYYCPQCRVVNRVAAEAATSCYRLKGIGSICPSCGWPRKMSSAHMDRKAIIIAGRATLIEKLTVRCKHCNHRETYYECWWAVTCCGCGFEYRTQRQRVFGLPGAVFPSDGDDRY